MYKQPKFFKTKCVVCGKDLETEIRLKPQIQRGRISHWCNECEANRKDAPVSEYVQLNQTWYVDGKIPVHLKDKELQAGNIITIKEPYDLDISINQDGSNMVHVKVGDKFIINQMARGTYLTGEAIGRTQRIGNMERPKYALRINEDAAIDFILKDLDCFCNLKEILKEHDVNEDDFKYVIEETLDIINH